MSVVKDILKKAIFLSALGLILGLTIGVVLWIIGTPNALDVKESIHTLIVYLVVSALYGMTAMGSSVVYDIEKWSIAKATSVHFVVTLVGFYILGISEGWLHFNDAIFYIMTVSFIVMYFIIWFIQYMSFKATVDRLNRDLKKLNMTDNEE